MIRNFKPNANSVCNPSIVSSVELKRNAKHGYKRITPLSSARYMMKQVIYIHRNAINERASAHLRSLKTHTFVQGIEKGVEGIKLEEKAAEEKKDRSQVKDKSAQLEAKLEKENQKKMQSHVIIKRVERTKRKCVTTIHGLEVFDVDLKKAAKMFANRFACGSSVAKNNQNQDEIVVQGDFSDELLDLILGNWPHIPEDNIDLVEDKKKK